MVDQAKENDTTGFFTIVEDEENGTNEIFFSNEKDYTVAGQVWRWNIDGIAYSSTGYKGPWMTSLLDKLEK